MKCTNCGKPADNLLCPDCENDVNIRLLGEALAREERERMNARRRLLYQLKKVKQRPLEFTE